MLHILGSVERRQKTKKLDSMGYIFVADSIGLSSFKSLWWLRKHMLVWNSAHWLFNVIQGRWKRLCNFLLVINSNLGRIFPRFRDIAGFSSENSDPTPIPPEFWGVAVGLDRW